MTAALYLLCTSAQSGGSGEGLAPLVEFYSKLPKGSAPARASSGIKARYFEGANASGKPLAFTILALLGLGYTIDYNSAFSPPFVAKMSADEQTLFPRLSCPITCLVQ